MASLRYVFSFLSLALLLCSLTEAREFLVGGHETAWTIDPVTSSESLNEWAQTHRFRIGDSLIWKFDPKTESVLQVKREHYESCNASNPIEEYKDGDVKVKLDRSGPFYFISGAEGHCEKGVKIVVVVLSKRHGTSAIYTSLSPAPAPSSAAPPSHNGSGRLRGGLMGMIMWVGMGTGTLIALNLF